MAKKILVVDDEPDIVAVMKFTLENRGFEVITAYDGKEGLNKAKRFNPDLIILDVLMPQMYGNTLVAELEENPQTKGIPIIFLSCLVNKSGEGVKQDMWGRLLLSKSCSEEELLDAIDKMLGETRNNNGI
ncbi:two-component system response regulator [Candidatus Pacearchaeota archaeon]|nr:MAG: two-component system response regulator [Candidatus Pacearchaeota archaeon]